MLQKTKKKCSANKQDGPGEQASEWVGQGKPCWKSEFLAKPPGKRGRKLGGQEQHILRQKSSNESVHGMSEEEQEGRNGLIEERAGREEVQMVSEGQVTSAPESQGGLSVWFSGEDLAGEQVEEWRDLTQGFKGSPWL